MIGESGGRRKFGIRIDGKLHDFEDVFAAFAGYFHWSYAEIMRMGLDEIEFSYRAWKKIAKWVSPLK